MKDMFPKPPVKDGLSENEMTYSFDYLIEYRDKCFDTIKEELAYLRWFHANTDFGPSDSDVRYYMNKIYKSKHGSLPVGYFEEGEE